MRRPQHNTSLQPSLAWSSATPWTYGLMALLIFTGMTEGFDVQAMAMAAPLVAKAWAMSTAQMGWLLSVSVIGLVCGSLGLSPLGDRIGRRPAIIAALAIASVSTAAGAIAPSPMWLAVVRFAAGLGLGMALPNVIALSSEIVPPRRRVLAIVLVSAGYPLGAAAGGAIAGQFIPHLGYAAVFLVGGAATLMALSLCIVFAPESPSYLLSRPARRAELDKLARRLGSAPLTQPGADFHGRSTSVENDVGVRALFATDRRTITILLWVINFANTALVYFFFNWLPSLLVLRGATSQLAVNANGIFLLSGVFGGLAMAFLLPRVGPSRMLGLAYMVALITSITLVMITGFGAVLYATLALSGAAVIGSQFCLTALTNQFYPASIRTTATGYASGLGRLGAVFAPIAGGLALTVVRAPAHAFALAAVPASLALIGMLLLRPHVHRAQLTGEPASS